MPEDVSYAGKAATGAFFMVATRFFVRLLGLVSVTVLARVLTPEDFGVFGTAAIVLSFFLLLKEMGFSEAIVTTENVEKEDIDSLWTMRFILAFCTSAGLLLLTEPIAVFLKEPRVVEVLHLLAIIPIIDSFYSPASAFMLKEFKYAQNFLMRSADKLIRVIVVIIFALTLKSYWALVYGAMLATVLGAVVSQIAYPYRPSFTLSRLSKYKSFTSWTYWRGIVRFIASYADEFVVRGMASTSLFGVYHVARDLTRVLIVELISPLAEAFLPALVKVSGNAERFSNAVLNIVGVYLIAGAAISAGIILTADEIVLLLLGPQWKSAGYFLVFVSVGAACNAAGDINQSIFISKNSPRHGAMFWTARAFVFSVGCIAAGIYGGFEAVAITFSLGSVLILALEIGFLFHMLNCRFSWIGIVGKPAVATTAMVLAVNMLSLDDYNLFITTAVKVSVGAISYVSVLAFIWLLSGKPNGPEKMLVERLPYSIRKRIIGKELGS